MNTATPTAEKIKTLIEFIRRPGDYVEEQTPMIQTLLEAKFIETYALGFKTTSKGKKELNKLVAEVSNFEDCEQKKQILDLLKTKKKVTLIQLMTQTNWCEVSVLNFVINELKHGLNYNIKLDEFAPNGMVVILK